MKNKKLRLVLAAAGVGLFACLGCGCTGYLLAPPSDIVGIYDDEPVTVAGSWQEQWEFKDTGVGTVKRKTMEKDKMTVVHFKYQYTRQFPEVRMAWFTPEIATHRLELSDCAGDVGAELPKGLGTPGDPNRAPTLVASRRFSVSVLDGNTILAPEDRSIPAVVLKRR